MIWLPDVNVLLALLDSVHTHHSAASRWFADSGSRGWATCPITENGFVRVVSGVSYPNIRINAAQAAAVLRTFKSNFPKSYRFWPDQVSLTDPELFDLDLIKGANQATDAYLAGLAHHNGGRLATFDKAIDSRVVRGSKKDLVSVISG